MPAAGDHGVAEALALLVLAQLEVHADQALEHAQEAGALAPAAVERAAQRGRSSSTSAPTASMTCSA
jgi:hypothetical protein